MVRVLQFEICCDFQIRVSVSANGDHAHFTQGRLADMVKRTFKLLSVHLSLAPDKLALFHIGSDGELPVGSRLALGNDVGGVRAVGDDFARDFEHIVFHARRDHADAGARPVLMVCEQRNRFREFHSAQVDHDRILPAGQRHLPAGVRSTDDFRTCASGSFNQGKFVHASSFVDVSSSPDSPGSELLFCASICSPGIGIPRDFISLISFALCCRTPR